MKASLLVILMTCICPLMFAQPIYQKYLKKSDVTGNFLRCIPTSDGGYASVGYLTDNVAFEDNSLIGKFTRLGDREWIKSVSYVTNNDEFTDITEVSGNAFVAAGTSYDPLTFKSVGVVAKFDENGNYIWYKILRNGNLSCNIKRIQKDNSGNLYLLGMVETSGSTFDYCLLKLDVFGNIQQQYRIGTEYGDYALSFIRNNSGEFIISGWANNGTGESIQVIKLNQNLSVAWNTCISGSVRYFADDMREKSNGNLVLGGRYDDGINPLRVMVLELDKSTGNVVWAKRYQPDSGNGIYANGIAVNTNDRIGITGIVEDFNSSVLVAELSSTGTVNWSKRINSNDEINSMGNGICSAPDQGYLVCGQRTGIDSSSVQIIKVNATGGFACLGSSLPLSATDLSLPVQSNTITVSTSSITETNDVLSETSFQQFTDACQPLAAEEYKKAETISVYPNPSDGAFVVRFDETGETIEVSLYDIHGKQVYANRDVTDSILDLRLDLKPGVYFLRALINGENITQKVIIR